MRARATRAMVVWALGVAFVAACATLPKDRAQSTAVTGETVTESVAVPRAYAYLKQVQSKISKRWAPPHAASAGGESAVILFEIDREGQIKEPSIEKSSGNAVYDQSALRAVIEASPFSPLPPEFTAPSLRVHFRFDFTAP
jgi:TonB family protein